MPQQLLLNFLLSKSEFTNSEIDRIHNVFRKRVVERGETLINKGDICNEMFFIGKGLLRAYYFTENGTEFTRILKKEGEFCSNLQSFAGRIPSLENIEALEDGNVFAIGYNDFKDFISVSKNAETAYRKILEDFQTFHIRRFEFLTSNSAQNKVSIFLKEEPELAKRAKDKIIASYLQMSPETYCRIKNKILKS